MRTIAPTINSIGANIAHMEPVNAMLVPSKPVFALCSSKVATVTSSLVSASESKYA